MSAQLMMLVLLVTLILVMFPLSILLVPHCIDFHSETATTEDIDAKPDLKELMTCIAMEITTLIDTKTTFVGNAYEGDASELLQKLKTVSSPVSGDVHPEACLWMKRGRIQIALCGMQAKRGSIAISVAKPQGFGLAADLIWNLHCFNCKIEYCVAPILLGNGEIVQFGAAYMMSKNVVVFCLLSRKLNRLKRDDIVEIRWWVHHLARFLVNIFEKACETWQVPDSSRLAELELGPCLDAPNLFFKHIRKDKDEILNTNFMISSHRATLTRILQVYQALYNCSAKKYVLFLCGTTQSHVPQRGRRDNIHTTLIHKIMVGRDNMRLDCSNKNSSSPLLVYPYLRHPWTKNIPESKHEKSFIRELRAAVQACSQADVVFLNLKMSNVMWRLNEHEQVEINLIDFEDVYFKGDLIPAVVVKDHQKDVRRNVKLYCELREDVHFADTKTNTFSVNIIEAFVNFENRDTSTTQSPPIRDKFTAFMSREAVYVFVRCRDD